ncbi:uncharacterized protein LOC123510913 isoform X2 [Portunus trituberculatus]|uniref:uncharacterized protein LOC123510913 isoform X2 n=1 Tax=Portunus trituberculatus TaxID=210409 RepID=UPI001E1D18D0|nr:uncharacterized protein LOC123510913 isoform X2 [Portunus trituberculatus]
MADNNKPPKDWELRSFSSGKLKKSSSVEILLGTHPTRGRFLATSPLPSSRVTSHNMKGSGRPSSTPKAGTLPSSTAPLSGAAPPSVQNVGVKDQGSVPNNTVPQNKAAAKTKETVPSNAVPQNKAAAKTKETVPSNAVPQNNAATKTKETVPSNAVPGKKGDVAIEMETVPSKPAVAKENKAVTPELTGSNSSLIRMLEPTPVPVPVTSTPVAAKPPPPVLPTPLHTPPLARLKNLKDKGSHLPPLNTSHKLDQSPMSTPRETPKSTPKGTPKGTPIIGKRGHVFSVSTPDVEPETGQPLPFPFERTKKPVTECLSDPFEVRRKIKPLTEPVLKEKSGGEEEEPVWQRRLSLLFVPPTEDELEPEKEPEETTRLLPALITPLILRKQSVDSVASPPISRRKDRLERAIKKKEKEASKKERQAREKLIREEARQPRINFEEENNKREEERKKKEKEEPRRAEAKFSRLRNSFSTQRGVIGKAAEAEDKEESFRSPFEASHNSLSSLIRERMGKTPPGQGKKTTQLGLVVLVVVLLVVIVVGISLTHYFYHLHLLELSIFNRIKFYEGPRHLEVYDPTWKPVITLHMGTNLPKYSIPEDCTDYLNYLQDENYTLPHHGLDDDEYEEMICLDWTALAQLHLRKLYAAGSVQCYTVWWVALKHDFTLRDCLMPSTTEHVEVRNITWWGGGEMSSGGFPISRADVPPEEMVTGKLNRDPWGQLLRRTWLSDHATLLMLPSRFGGRVSVNHNQDNKVCLEMHVTACTDDDANLSYTVCTAPNLTALAGYMHQRAVEERHSVGTTVPSLVNYSMEEVPVEESEGEEQPVAMMRETFNQEVVARVEERLEHPVWVMPETSYLTQQMVVDYVQRLDRLLANTTGTRGHVLLPPTWQTRPGELEFDPERFPDPLGLSQVTRDKGFHLALTLHPFVSVDAPGFKEGMREGLWVRQKKSRLPALARYENWHPSVVTDFSNPRARRWYAAQLNGLRDEYEVDRFHLQPADAHALPVYHEYHTPFTDPDDTLVHFMASVSSVSPPISTEGAVMPPLPPTFVTMGSGEGSWKELETLVPRALTMTMLGYPFIDVGLIGGPPRGDSELYIRWIEAATFLPAMQISVLPDTYGEEVLEIAKQYQDLRKTLVLPRLLEKVPAALQNGTPLITPLVLFAPQDTEALKVDDQWMLSDDLLVAPVTHRGRQTRDVYLPKGIWKDGITGKLKNGGRWIRDYQVPLTKIPYFILRPVDDFRR